MILAVSLFLMNRYGDSMPVLNSELPTWLHKVRMLVSLPQAFVSVVTVQRPGTASRG